MHAFAVSSHLSRWRVVGATVLTLALTGCPLNPSEPDEPPIFDTFDRLERDPACTLTGSLELELVESEGWLMFRALPPEGPTVHHGPQGGTHLELGVRVANPASEFPGLQMKFTAETQGCGASGCDAFELRGQYSTVVREPVQFMSQPDGAQVVSSLLVLVNDFPSNTRRRITVEALDRCGRTGTTVWEVAASSP